MVNKTFNLQQMNPVAPMAIGAEDFKTHEKTKYPFTPEPKRAKCVKVILNSTDRQAGSTLTSARFNISLPTEFQNKRLNLVVDSFIEGAAPNSVSNLFLYPYYIRINEYRNLHSYHSYTQTTSGMILLTSGIYYQNNSPRDVGGSCVFDTTLLDRPITIEFWSPHFNTATANGISNDWSLVLSLWDDVVE
jgi:hypothetical protein